MLFFVVKSTYLKKECYLVFRGKRKIMGCFNFASKNNGLKILICRLKYYFCIKDLTQQTI